MRYVRSVGRDGGLCVGKQCGVCGRSDARATVARAAHRDAMRVARVARARGVLDRVARASRCARARDASASARSSASTDARLERAPAASPASPRFRFEVLRASTRSNARAGMIHTPHGTIATPGYVAVGTNAAMKAVQGDALRRAGIDLMFANTYHLMLQPGAATVEAMGGIHAFMGRRGPVITDSGGFQVFSLGTPDRSANAKGKTKELKSRKATKHRRENLLIDVSEEGATFRSYRDGTKMTLTPESSVLSQKQIGADIIIPLDELPPYDIDRETLEESVHRSHRWMTRSLETHLKDVRQQAMYGVVHGGVDRELRRMSVEYLSALPFDGLAIGGSLGRDAAELGALLEFLMPLLPKHLPNHLLGIADMENIEHAVANGVDTFDSCYPTQVARHGTLFTRSRGRINFRRAEFRTSTEPACEECECTLCTKHTLGYLHHLDRANEPLAWSLASEHNLYHMGDKMRRVREGILNGEI